MARLRITALILILLEVVSFQGFAVEQNLPSIGEPVDRLLSPYEEQEIGKEFMKQARKSLPLIEDHELNEYIQRLGERLVATAKNTDYQFTFFLLEDDSINAFAVPGGYIGINSGLIQSFKTEGQVASVVAHEIAHVTQRHHARAYSARGSSGFTTAAAIIAAILLGQNSPEMGQAALATGLAVTQQKQINYTRANEYEADRVGIEILRSSGFAAGNMAEAFTILNKNASLNSSGLQIEYLRTHPLNTTRIAEAKNRAAIAGDFGEKDSLSFRLFKMRLASYTTIDKIQLKRRLQATHKNVKENASLIYGLALLAQFDNQIQEGLDLLDQLKPNDRQHYAIKLLETRLLSRSSEDDKAKGIDILRELRSLNPGRFSAASELANQLSALGNYDQAYHVLTDYVRSNTKPQRNPEVFKQLADLEIKRGNPAVSHEYLASYYENRDQQQQARQQLEIALRKVETGSLDELRISAHLKRLKKDRKSSDSKR